MMSARSGKTDVLNQRIPENPRYKDVKATVDSGASLNRYLAKLDDIRQNYRYRNNEIFKRMKITTLVQLILQVHSIQKMEDSFSSIKSPDADAKSEVTDATLDFDEDEGSSDSQQSGSPAPSLALTAGDYGETVVATPRSTLQSVIRGIGEFDLEQNPAAIDGQPASRGGQDSAAAPSSCPYLLLDLRDKYEYEMGHIIGAHSYPSAMLSRAYNCFTKEITDYRNKNGKIIVIYDEDERLGIQCATTFVERGFENLFLLSGGLKVACHKFPQGLVTGSVPPSCLPPPPTKKGRAKKSSRPPAPVVKASLTQFDAASLEHLQTNLDDILVPSDSASRLSRGTRSTTSRKSELLTARSTASYSSLHSKAWK